MTQGPTDFEAIMEVEDPEKKEKANHKGEALPVIYSIGSNRVFYQHVSHKPMRLEESNVSAEAIVGDWLNGYNLCTFILDFPFVSELIGAVYGASRSRYSYNYIDREITARAGAKVAKWEEENAKEEEREVERALKIKLAEIEIGKGLFELKRLENLLGPLEA